MLEIRKNNNERKILDVDTEVDTLLREVESLLGRKTYSKKEFTALAERVWLLLEQTEVNERLHNPQALKNLSLKTEQRNEQHIRNGMWVPGGGLSCVGGFGTFDALLKVGFLQNVDEIIASSGSSWVTAYALAALDNIKMIQIGISVFARDLRGRLFIDKTLGKVLRRLWRQHPLLNLDRVYKLVGGKIKGIKVHGAVGNDKREFKKLDYDSVLRHSSMIRFLIVMTNYETQKPEYFDVRNASNFRELLFALRASSSFPGILSKGSVRVNHGRFCDGDLSSAPFEKFREDGVNSVLASLSRPLRRSFGIRLPKPVELFLFFRNEKAKKLEDLFRDLDLRYLRNIMEMIRFGKDHPLYVLDPDEGREIHMSSNQDLTHKKMFRLSYHMYKKAREALGIAPSSKVK